MGLSFIVLPGFRGVEVVLAIEGDRKKRREKEGKGSTAVSRWLLWRRVVTSSLPETVLGITGLGKSENKTSRGGWGGCVIYVRQVGHQKYHCHQNHKDRHYASREGGYRT